jgi:hypothetical protein
MDTEDRLASLTDVCAAETWMRAQMECYAATCDPSDRAVMLMGLLGALSEPRNLRAICDDLAESDRYRDFAYRHNNGFYVLYLMDPNIGFQSRFHVWMPGETATIEKPHRHRMSFASKVLSGEIRSIHFERIPYDSALWSRDLAEGEGLYHETWINAPACGSFDIANTELVSRGDVVLRVASEHHYRSGDAYLFPASGIHQVTTPSDLASPNITMTVWELPFQDSIAYEAFGWIAGGARKRLPVNRLSDAKYRELIEEVRRVSS